MIEHTEMRCLFKAYADLSYARAKKALESGYALLISRCAFYSEEDVRRNYPPKPGEEIEWKENAILWYEGRRHMYVVCIDPGTSQYMTSSTEPDKTRTPWTLSFCSEEMAITQLDKHICQSVDLWLQYKTAAILLPKLDYPPELIIPILRRRRLNLNSPIYSIDPQSGYDCQTATRDLLWAVNQTINPKTLLLPEGTNVLAYYSEQVLHPESAQVLSYKN